ncbi:MAG: alpha/beta fold hydrolase [Dehalococcoidia bacterium]|nr:alpha/beta fold hydrolase [Dehalococcoidia bacterium]
MHLLPDYPGSRSAILAAMLALALVSMGCGGDAGDPGGDSLPTPIPTPTEDVQEMPTATAISPTPTFEALPATTPPPLPTSTPVALELKAASSTDLSWSNGDGFVGGTLTSPAMVTSGARAPAVLLIANGGGADRDWVSTSLPGDNGSGRLIASALTDAGYVTLRYDRRGTGRRIGETTPPDGENFLGDSIDEVSSAIRFLKSRPEVDPDRVYIVAHDEGALHVLLREVQLSEPDVAGIALLAPSALTLRQQVFRKLGALAQEPGDEVALAALDAAMAFFIEGDLPEGDLGLSPDLQGLFENLTHPSKLPYNTEIWNLDPVSLLPEAGSPVLVLIGRLDSDVDWDIEGPSWEEAASIGQEVEYVYPPNADHVLKATSPDDPEIGLTTYNASGRRLDEESLMALLDWLNARSGL